MSQGDDKPRPLTAPLAVPQQIVAQTAFKQSTIRTYRSAEALNGHKTFVNRPTLHLATEAGGPHRPGIAITETEGAARFHALFNNTQISQPQGTPEMETGDLDHAPALSGQPSLEMRRDDDSKTSGLGGPSMAHIAGSRYKLVKTATGGLVMVEKDLAAPPILSPTVVEQIVNPRSLDDAVQPEDQAISLDRRAASVPSTPSPVNFADDKQFSFDIPAVDQIYLDPAFHVEETHAQVSYDEIPISETQAAISHHEGNIRATHLRPTCHNDAVSLEPASDAHPAISKVRPFVSSLEGTATQSKGEGELISSLISSSGVASDEILHVVPMSKVRAIFDPSPRLDAHHGHDTTSKVQPATISNAQPEPVDGEYLAPNQDSTSLAWRILVPASKARPFASEPSFNTVPHNHSLHVSKVKPLSEMESTTDDGFLKDSGTSHEEQPTNMTKDVVPEKSEPENIPSLDDTDSEKHARVLCDFCSGELGTRTHSPQHCERSSPENGARKPSNDISVQELRKGTPKPSYNHTETAYDNRTTKSGDEHRTSPNSQRSDFEELGQKLMDKCVRCPSEGDWHAI
ncbi:hypothetical protein G7046_g1099 [Stylonectria norvegica]|nr:hypothetical protein G7046_g1099 [Stylonectria norvegica]